MCDDNWDDEPPMATLVKKPATTAAMSGWDDEVTVVQTASKPSSGNDFGWKEESRNSCQDDANGTDNCVEQIEVDPGKVGRIVGSKGATIQQLQDEFQVKIDIDREENMNGKKDVKVSGSRSNVERAVEEIKQKTADFQRRENDNGFSSFGFSGSHSETIEVETGMVGRIVGSKGATINQLQDDFSVKINISKEDNMNSKRDVEVCGDQENVAKAMDSIKAMVEGGSGGFGSRADNNGGGDGGRPREVYVPAEPAADGDSLFDNSISPGVNFKKFENIKVKVSHDGVAIKPIENFEDAHLRQIVMDNVSKAGYTNPTPVQKHAIPAMMAGRDLMACAQTGSGKTAAFLLPIINQLLEIGESAEQGSIRALIVTPTRELAIQIFDEARKFSLYSWIKVCLAYGGVQTSYQINKIQQGCHILVATPGRLCDLVGKNVVTYSSLKFLVLDEADRMLDMGFKSKMEEISTHPSYQKANVQVVMFSATFPKDIQVLAAAMMKQHVFLTVGVVGSASTDVTQRFEEVERKEKKSKLFKWLKEELKKDSNKRILIFTETKKTTDFLASYLTEMNISSTSIHGDRFQRERELAINEFRKGIRKVLIATSVAARGLDIKDVTDVVNYDLPKSVDEYVHRIGRTGRVGNLGSALSFYDRDNDHEISSALVDILQQSGQEVPDFLGSGTYAGAANANQFGAEDIRATNAGTVQEVVEDEW